jgi:hypothetical protein
MVSRLINSAVAVVGTVVALAVVSGCSSSASGAPAPTAPAANSGTAGTAAGVPTVPTGASRPANGGAAVPTTTAGTARPAPPPKVDAGRAAPKVTKPLDASHVTNSPCATMNGADLTALGFTGTKPSAAGSQCSWNGPAGASVRIVWQTIAVSGLTDVYAEKSSMYYFVPTTVRGYPAVYASPFSDRRADGDCTLYTAVDNATVFSTQYVAAPANAGRACELAKQAASQVIRDLGGA